MGRAIVRYDGPGDIYVFPDLGIEVAKGGTCVLSEGRAQELLALVHDHFTIVGVESEPTAKTAVRARKKSSRKRQQA